MSTAARRKTRLGSATPSAGSAAPAAGPVTRARSRHATPTEAEVASVAGSTRSARRSARGGSSRPDAPSGPSAAYGSTGRDLDPDEVPGGTADETAQDVIRGGIGKARARIGTNLSPLAEETERSNLADADGSQSDSTDASELWRDSSAAGSPGFQLRQEMERPRAPALDKTSRTGRASGNPGGDSSSSSSDEDDDSDFSVAYNVSSPSGPVERVVRLNSKLKGWFPRSLLTKQSQWSRMPPRPNWYPFAILSLLLTIALLTYHILGTLGIRTVTPDVARYPGLHHAMREIGESLHTISNTLQNNEDRFNGLDSHLKDELDGKERELKDLQTELIEKFEIIQTEVTGKFDSIQTEVTGKFNGKDHELKLLQSSVDSLQRKMEALSFSIAMLDANAPSTGVITAMRQVNFFAPSHGAFVNPGMTTPTISSMPKPPIHRLKEWLYLQSSHSLPPAAALERWEEVGDCWCAPPTKGSNGRSQLAVRLGHRVVPTELIVEHIPRSATLDSGTAPEEVELWVRIEDRRIRDEILKFTEDSNPEFRNAVDLSRGLGKRYSKYNYEFMDQAWVRIGAGKYDINNENTPAQVIRAYVNIGEFGVSTTDVVVRALTNQAGKDHTCVYRYKLHGLLAEEDPDAGFEKETWKEKRPKMHEYCNVFPEAKLCGGAGEPRWQQSALG
ncbi:hypothetical protein MMC09_000683 [Bachmanniomyces sp. S44760]|nr:hypothetical protein [Bachmanniomyces sp. S44760]